MILTHNENARTIKTNGERSALRHQTKYIFGEVTQGNA
jgi:hypothetical protein